MSISNVLSQTGRNYACPAAGRTGGRTEAGKNSQAMVLTAVNGSATMVCRDALFSIGSAATGESANVYRAEDYSEDNPVYFVKGTDAQGNQYEQEIDVRNVNPASCTYIELLALNVDAGNTSDYNFLQLSVIRDGEGATSFFDKANYLSMAYKRMAEQQRLGSWDSYLNWGKWIKSIERAV